MSRESIFSKENSRGCQGKVRSATGTLGTVETVVQEVLRNSHHRIREDRRELINNYKEGREDMIY